MKKDENTIKEEMDQELSDDIHVKSISVPGGWIYITYARKKEGGEYITTALSTCYVPGRR